MHVTKPQVTEGPNVDNHIALYAFHSFLGEVQVNGGHIHAAHE